MPGSEDQYFRGNQPWRSAENSGGSSDQPGHCFTLPNCRAGHLCVSISAASPSGVPPYCFFFWIKWFNFFLAGREHRNVNTKKTSEEKTGPTSFCLTTNENVWRALPLHLEGSTHNPGYLGSEVPGTTNAESDGWEKQLHEKILFKSLCNLLIWLFWKCQTISNLATLDQDCNPNHNYA